MKLTVGQTWRMNMPELGNQAYFLVTRFSEENRGWMALALSLGVGWKPVKDGDEMLFHVGDDVEPKFLGSKFLELVCDASDF